MENLSKSDNLSFEVRVVSIDGSGVWVEFFFMGQPLQNGDNKRWIPIDGKATVSIKLSDLLADFRKQEGEGDGLEHNDNLEAGK